MLRWLQRIASSRVRSSPVTQAEIDFTAACPLLEFNERVVAEFGSPDWSLAATAATDWESRFIELENKWRAAKLSETISFANDSVTIQLSEMFQHIADVDSGDLQTSPLLSSVSGVPALPARTKPAALPGRSSVETNPPVAASVATDLNAADDVSGSIGPSTHTNPTPTVAFKAKDRHRQQTAAATIEYKRALAARHGFALWVGPSQAPTPLNRAGLYIKGYVAPGTVVGLYPGAVFNSEMLQQAQDQGHLGNPRVPRLMIPRFDGSVIDVHAATAPTHNPYAIAFHARHPPPSIQPNVMRLQYDFVAESDNNVNIPFPAHLRDYIPNVWGSDVTMGQQLYGMLEQNIWVKGMVLVALRPLRDEELFVDHMLPLHKAPKWYTPVNPERNRRIWDRITA